MKPELEKQLVEKYPKIFKMVGSTPQESCMAWGIECRDGWYQLIYELCRELQHNTDVNGQPQIVAAQVKQKFGGLRFYVNSGTDEQYGSIHFAETFSLSICEECGTTKDVGQTEGWISTLCEKCAKKLGRTIKEDRVKTIVVKNETGTSYNTEFPSEEE